MHSPIPRNDRYNKKLKKYYVVYEENDTDVSEDEERHERRDQEVPHSLIYCATDVDISAYLHTSWISKHISREVILLSPPCLQVDPDDVQFSRLGKPRDASGSEDEAEEKAVQVNTAQKETLGLRHHHPTLQSWLFYFRDICDLLIRDLLGRMKGKIEPVHGCIDAPFESIPGEVTAVYCQGFFLSG